MKLLLLAGLMTGSLWAGGLRVHLVSPPELKEAWRECAREHLETHRYQIIILGGDGSLDSRPGYLSSKSMGQGCRYFDRRLFHQSDLVDNARKSATYHQGICEISLLGDPTLQVK